MRLLASITMVGLTHITIAAELELSRTGQVTVRTIPLNAIVSLEVTNALTGICTNWPAVRNFYSAEGFSIAPRVELTNSAEYFRLRVFDLNGANGFSNLVTAYSTLTTLAGAGGVTGGAINKWQSSFENGPATNALLSRPHIALSDDAGNIYIADKDAHGIRKVRPDGTIVTVAGTSVPGDGPNTATLATAVALNEPNGLWLRGDGTFYILDLVNSKVRKVGTNGIATTLFTVPGGIVSGRGLWVSDDETMAFVASGTVLKRWTLAGGVENYSTGYSELGNISIGFSGMAVTDRGAHSVYALVDAGDIQPLKIRIAGNGSTGAGIDGAYATNCPLNQVRGVWTLPTGGLLLATDNGSQVWYVDLDQRIHLLLNGSTGHTHSGDGAYFYDPSAQKVSKVRQVTLDREGNMLITEHDAGYVRKVRFLPR